jgi:hypothetical protein
MRISPRPFPASDQGKCDLCMFLALQLPRLSHSVHATAAETAQEMRTGQWLSIWHNASKHYLQLESLLLTCTTWGLCDKEGRPHAPGFQPVALPLRVFCCLTTAPHHAPAGLPSWPGKTSSFWKSLPACTPCQELLDEKRQDGLRKACLTIASQSPLRSTLARPAHLPSSRTPARQVTVQIVKPSRLYCTACYCILLCC